ncbi:F-box domain-containing protein [Rhynchospora pubera]|uniref:F-box domain-containing protein n=1 Tax=Rhynchospora pubera TaxID=906938 RepID=A0AAV8C388_9POAL|nr:F-box domain-containing protein [Rhynchospora pubera]
MPFNISKKHTSYAAMEAKETLERDWSSLLPEVLNLSDISDFVRFRVVCKAWRSSTPTTDLPPQFPWILVNGSNKTDLECYSIPSNKFYTIHTPKSFSFLRGQEGYILTILCDQFGDSFTYQLSLLNPLNNHEIHIPAIQLDYRYPGFYPWKNQMGEYVVCYIDGRPNCKVGFWQLGLNNWCELKLDSACGRIFYLKNMFFIVEWETGITKAFDMGTGTLVYAIPPTEDYSTVDGQYMVEASGDILRVIGHFSGILFSERFDVYQLDAKEIGSPSWVKVTSIGNRALFIDLRGTMILGANDFAKIKRNSIYFYAYNEQCGRCEVKRMDIETGAEEHLQFSIKDPGYWYVHNIHHM